MLLHRLRAVPPALLLLSVVLSFAVMAAPVAHAVVSAATWYGKTMAGTSWQVPTYGTPHNWADTYIVPTGGFIRGPMKAPPRTRTTQPPSVQRQARVQASEALNVAGMGGALARSRATVHAGKTILAQAPALKGLADQVRNQQYDDGWLNLHPEGESFARMATYCGWDRTITSSAPGGSDEVQTFVGARTEAYISPGWPECRTDSRFYGGGTGQTFGIKPDGKVDATSCTTSFGDHTPSSFTGTATCHPGSGTRPGWTDLSLDNAGGNFIQDGGVWIYPGMKDAYDDWVKQNSRQGIEVTCLNTSTGARTKVVAYSPVGSLNAPIPKCGAGTTPVGIRQWLDHPLGDAGDTDLGGFELNDRALQDYANCLGVTSTGCQLGVAVDGEACSYARAECRDWWTTALQDPSRAECSWGPYTLGWAACLALRHAFATPGQTVAADPRLPGYYAPQPVDPVTGAPITNFPGAPVPGVPDPVYSTPLGCPDITRSVTASTVGLQPVAVESLRCILAQFPDIDYTSGYRTTSVSSDSDHPRGLAVDLSRPDWATEAGRNRLWDVASKIAGMWDVWNVRYVIFEDKIYHPGRGWIQYEYPGPLRCTTGTKQCHDDHVHVSFGPRVTTGPGADTPVAPGVNPYPVPGNPVYPVPSDPRPPTSPTPEVPGQPIPSDPARKPEGEEEAECWPSGWGMFNPADWVMKPVKCAWDWAVVPSPEAVTAVKTQIRDAGGRTGVPQWFDTVSAVGPALTTQETGDCMGPAMTGLPEPFPDVYLFEACDGVRAMMAGWTKAFMTVTLVVSTTLAVTNLLSRGFGYESRTESA